MWRRSAGGQVGVYCRGASILLVGTHKDRVPDPRDHERISYLLIDRFQAPPRPAPAPADAGNLTPECRVRRPLTKTIGHEPCTVWPISREP